jgi:hypothetical protein
MTPEPGEKAAGKRPRDHGAKSGPDSSPRSAPAAGEAVRGGTGGQRSSDESPELLPKISVPQGGGAIRGLGEKFSVSAATGTASLRVPLALSPGRPGFTPALELNYDSGAGNGPFGFGWKLSVPSISRKTDKGLPQYRDGDESDVFILEGSEDLVPVLDAAGARVSSPRRVSGIDYEIHLYRPRIEGLFSRIERWQNQTTGVSHWRTISNSNVTTLYGYDNQSTVADAGDAAKIFTWMICRSWDDKGNAAVYSYVAEDGQGVNLAAAHESNRSAAARATQRYLSLVEYANTEPYLPVWDEEDAETPLPTDWFFKVVFDYGDHPGDAPTPAVQSGWAPRPDPFSSYRSTFEIRTYRRVQRILYFNNFPAEQGVGAECLVRSTDLIYCDQQTPSDPHNPIYTFPVTVTQTGYRTSGGSYMSKSLPPLTFAYSVPVIRSQVATLDAESLENLPEGIDGTRFQWADLDGEGASGILADWGEGWGYKPNLSPANLVPQPDGSLRAAARFGPLQTVAELPSHGSLQGQRLLDLSGAGRLDLVDLSRDAAGYFERTADETWQPFEPFEFWPDLDWSDPNPA